MELEQALAEIAKLKADYEALNLQLTTATESHKSALDAVLVEKSELQGQLSSIEASLNEVKSAKDAAEAELNSIKANQVKASRIANLVTAGLTDVEAAEQVAKFENLSDEQFDAITALVKVKASASVSTETPAEEVVEEVVVEDVVETVVEEVVTETTEEVVIEDETKVSAGLKAWAETIFSKNKKNKITK